MTDGGGRTSEHSGLDVSSIFMLVQQMHRAQQEMARGIAPIIESIVELKEQTDQRWDEFVRVALAASERMHASLPRNWPRTGLKGVSEVLREDGIPLAYVPRPETVRAILDKADYESRMQVLVENRMSIVDDCRTATESHSLHPTVADLAGLIKEAQTLLGLNYLGGAHCLAVNICDTIVRRTMEPKWKYGKIVKTIDESGFDDDLLSVSLAFRPVLTFYATYDFGSATPPMQLSRHRTVHELSPEHTSEHNAVIAVMLATSVALAVSEWRIWLDDEDERSAV